MKAMVIIGVGMLCIMAGIAPPVHGAYELLHEFTGTDGDGAGPEGGLTMSGGKFYGTTQHGGDSDMGTIFSIGVNGSGYEVLHSFAPATDGGFSRSTLAVSADGNTLYGTTWAGQVGDNGGTQLGTLYSMSKDGSNFTVLHTFAQFSGGQLDGGAPVGSVTLSGSTLYGMTLVHGANDVGTIFSVSTSGNDFQVLHPFAPGVSDGASPYGSLTLSGSTLYGMTTAGGTEDKGTIFKINTDGTGFQVIHSFFDTDPGWMPEGNLTMSADGNTLYGAAKGEDDSGGILFSVNTDGTGFTVLHDFALTGDTEGYSPQGSLLLVGDTLYGANRNGGYSGERWGYNEDGTLFSIKTDGTDFKVLFSFEMDTSGWAPTGSLLAIANTQFYGMVGAGYPDGFEGGIFKFGEPQQGGGDPGPGGAPEPATVVGMGLAVIAAGLRRLKRKVR